MTSRTARGTTCTTLPPVILVDGNVQVPIDDALRSAFRPGDKLFAVKVETSNLNAGKDKGQGESQIELLLVPQNDTTLVESAVSGALLAGGTLRLCSDERLTQFFLDCATLLERDDIWLAICEVNAGDVSAALAKGRSTTRLTVSSAMRAAMIEGLRTWAAKSPKDEPASGGRTVEHSDWTCSSHRRELGVVAFVFEGRPNVVVDAVGVLRYRNTVVMRIGSDALATATAIFKLVIAPALEAAQLPESSVHLLQSTSHAAGWGLFSDRRVGLAVARGSGRTVQILGSIASSNGIPTSLHGKGGAWGIVSPAAATPLNFIRDVIQASITDSLDRKVCNTLNTILVPRALAPFAVPHVLDAMHDAARRRSTEFRLHYTAEAGEFVPACMKSQLVSIRRAAGTKEELQATLLEAPLDLGHEWEWEDAPEATLHVFDGPLEAAITLFNTFSPKFVLSLWSPNHEEHRWVLHAADAPFVGDRHTRWVDGQKALRQPELGLCNWENGRLLGRAGILTGADVGTTVLTYRSKEVL